VTGVRIIDAGEQVCDVVCEVAEGPIWDGRFDVLRWVDINRGLVHGWSPAEGPQATIDLGQHVGFVVPEGEDRLLAGVRDGFALVELDGGAMTLVRPVEQDRPHFRMNDGKADPAGRVWGGTMGIDELEPAGALYRLDGDWSVEAPLTDLTIPNGIGWSPDGSTMYFTDSTWGRIDAFAYDLASGTATERRTFVEIPADAGLPDGLTVDEDGCVWVALWYGAAVHRYTPDGRLDTVVRVPAAQATSCVFGGTDGQDLFITSGQLDISEQARADHPLSGRVFTCRPGAVGLRTDAYAPSGVPALTMSPTSGRGISHDR